MQSTENLVKRHNVSSSSSALAPSCRSGAPSSPTGEAAFYFWQGGGSATRQPVRAAPILDEHSGLCIYPDANCGPRGPCCSSAPWAEGGRDTSDILTSVATIILIVVLVMYIQRFITSIQKGQDESQRVVKRDEWHKMNEACLFSSLVVNIFTAVAMAKLTQAYLPVHDRNAMLAALAVLTPVSEVFQFVEDSVSVKIGYALGKGCDKTLRKVLQLGVFGGLAMGCMAAGLMSLLAAWPAAMRKILSPTQSLSSCSLLPSPDEVVRQAVPFWLLSAWAWPLNFAGMAFQGVLLGAREYGIFALATVSARFLLVGTWLSYPPSLQLLGTANLLSSATFVAVCVISMSLNSRTRSRFLGIGATPAERLLGTAEDAEEPQALDPHVLTQGLQAMVVDLCVQLGMTAGVFLVANKGTVELYQISALQAAMPQYGMVLGIGFTYGLKLMAAALIGRQRFTEFSMLVSWVIRVSFVAAGLAFPLVLLFKPNLAVSYGSPACLFATDASCAPIFEGVFTRLQDSFTAFAPAAFSLVLYNIFKSGLYGCFDFEFMAKAGLAVLLLISIPATCAAALIWKSATAMYAAMYLPVLVLALIFLQRLRWNCARMARGEPGPWTDKDAIQINT